MRPIQVFADEVEDDLERDGEVDGAEALEARLEELEQQIEVSDGLIGEALLEIRDQRLYQREFDSFEIYLRARWGMKASTAYDHIRAAEVRAVLGVETAGRSQCVEISRLPREEWPSAAREAAGASVRKTREVVSRRLRVDADGSARPRRLRVARVLKAAQSVTRVLDALTDDNLQEELDEAQLAELRDLLARVRERLDAIARPFGLEE